MAIQLYGTKASRNLLRAEMEMLKHAEPIIVLGKYGTHKKQPLRKTDTVVFRRMQPFNADSDEVPSITPGNFITSEGLTPDPHTITYTDVTCTLNHYSALFEFSAKVELTYEDDIPGDMMKLTGETIAEIAELVAYGQYKSGSNVVYANGSTRVGVNSAISLDKLRAAARSLNKNRAKKVTKQIAPGPNFNTSGVDSAFVVFADTDCASDIQDLPNFKSVVEYGSAMKKHHPQELGACEEFRFILSPLLKPYLAGGASVGTTGMKAADDTTIDVYPMIVIGEDAIGHVALSGHGYTGISPTLLSSQTKNHANPSGQFGYVGADFWYNAVRLNDNWMCVIETAVRDL